MRFLKYALIGLGFMSVANAANITIFYSPTCPHCHHARDFIKNELIYEYDNLQVTEINAVLTESRDDFLNALKKCNYTNGGVPVMVIGDKCFQGYGDGMKNSIREAIEVDLSDEQKKAADTNRAEMKTNHDAFVSGRAARKNAIIDKNKDVKKN